MVHEIIFVIISENNTCVVEFYVVHFAIGMDKFNYKILREIGKGSFGKVYKARKVRSDYAIKKVRCDAPENVELALQEFWTLSSLKSHENIIRFEECYLQHGDEIRPMKHGDKSSPSYMYLVEMAVKGKRGWDQAQYYLWFVMEYCNCGDMNEYILDRDPIPYLNTIFMNQLADGISFLHRSNVVHRDLKPENVLVRSWKGRDPVLKIADFGLSKVCNPMKDADHSEDDSTNVDTFWLSSACGSDFFMAPEVFEGRYTAKADVFALGIMFWAIMDRITFIDAGTKKVLLGTYVRRNKEVLPVGEALLDDPNLDMTQLLVDTGQGPSPGQRSKRSHSRSCVAGNKKKLRDLIAQMVHPNPEFRPSSQELLRKLDLILQPDQRPRGLRLNSRKTMKKDDFNIQKTLNFRETSDRAALHDENCGNNIGKESLMVQKTLSHEKSDIEKDFLQNGNVADNSQSSASERRGKTRQITLFSSNRSGMGEKVRAKIRQMDTNIEKAKRKVSAVAKKQKPGRTTTRSLRSAANCPKLGDIAQLSSDKVVKGSVRILPTLPEITKACEKSRSPDKNIGPVNAFPNAGCRPSNNNTGDLSLTEVPLLCTEREVEFDAECVLDTDVDSRDSSTISEIPEFDSGYKSKRSRWISHVTDEAAKSNSDVRHLTACDNETCNSVNSKDLFHLGNGANSVASLKTSLTTNVCKNPSYHWRRNGLKEQIRACKSSSNSDPRWEVSEITDSHDSSFLQCSELQSEQKVAKTTVAPVLPKPKLEVPRTPCVVMQSRAKIRHNPFHTAVKKRWKYVILDKCPSSLETALNEATGNELDLTEGSSAEKMGSSGTSRSSTRMVTEIPCRSNLKSPSDHTGKPATGNSASQVRSLGKWPCTALDSGSDMQIYAQNSGAPCSQIDHKMGSNSSIALRTEEQKPESGDGKNQLDGVFSPQPDEKFGTCDTAMHQSSNPQCHLGCCKRKSSQFQNQMIQHLSSYWYPGKRIQPTDSKSTRRQVQNQGLVLFGPEHSSKSGNLSNSYSINDGIGQVTSGFAVRSNTITEGPSIPVIDLTHDCDLMPPSKKPKRDDEYSLAGTSFGINPRKFHPPKSFYHWNGICENSKNGASGGDSIKSRHAKPAMQSGLPLYTYKAPHQRCSDIYRLSRSNSVSQRDSQLDHRQSLHVNSASALLQSVLPPPLPDSNIEYSPYRRVLGSHAPYTFNCPSLSGRSLPSYNANVCERYSDNPTQTADLRNAQKFASNSMLLHQSHIISSNGGAMIYSAPHNLLLGDTLNGTLPQEMQTLYSTPQLIRKPVTGLTNSYNCEITPNSSFCSAESNILGQISYPCHLRHSKPILNN